MTSFHNSIALQGRALGHAREKAKTQDQFILSIFVLAPKRSFTAYEIFNSIISQPALLTSVRRSINTLEMQGLIVKCDEKRMGHYGVVNFTYKLAVPGSQMKLF